MRKKRTSVWTRSLIASIPVALALAGCDTTSESGPESGTDSDSVDDRVAYYEDVRPLLAEHCVACHTEGSIAPFPLDSYEAVLDVAPLVQAVVQARTMPPFGVRADGSCQEWDEPRWLTDDEIETISAWVDQGTMAGDDTIEAPSVPELPTLDGHDVAEVGIPEYRAEGTPELGLEIDDYQCFLIELDLPQDRYLVGFDVLADNDAIVHHVLGFRVDPSFLGNGAAMAELDGQTPEPGWDCFGAAGEGVLPQGVPVTWAPGQGAVEFPHDVGVRFAPGDVLVVQMHYNLLEAEGTDATRIKLKWADEVQREGFQILWDPFLFASFQGDGATLEPGRPSVQYAWQASFEEMMAFDGLEFDRIDLLGVIPHMHARGQNMSIAIDRGGDSECAADVDRYDYNWQRTYFYEQPISVTKDDALDVVCDFDTSDATQPVAAGFGTQDEMCLVGLFFTPG